MKNIRGVVAIVLAVSAMLGGCARVAFYKDEKLTDETGIKFYNAKPYLVVAHTGAKDNPIQVSIVYVPDLANPTYAKSWTGLGTTNLTLSLTNGMLSSVGQQTDSKIPELITSLGSFTTALAGAAKTLIAQAGVDFTKTGQDLIAIADDVKSQSSFAKAHDLLSPLDMSGLADIEATLRGAGKLLLGPSGGANLATASAQLTEALKKWDQIALPSATAGPGSQLRDRLNADKQRVAGILKSLMGGEKEPTVLLYEFDNSGGTTKLIPVVVP